VELAYTFDVDIALAFAFAFASPYQTGRSGSAREGDMGSEGPQFGACGSSHSLRKHRQTFSLHNLILYNVIQSDSHSLSVMSISI
jgi:hypothetical protein